MKTFAAVAILTILSAAKGDCYHVGEPLGGTVSEIAQQALECVIASAADGFPELGIPPLDPLYDEHIVVNLDFKNLFSARGIIESFKMTGVSDIKVSSLTVEIARLQFNFDIVVPSIDTEGWYDINATIAGFIPFVGKGFFRISPQDARIQGHIRLGSQNKTLYVKEVVAELSLGAISFRTIGLGADDLNDLLNKSITESLPGIIKCEKQLISEYISAAIKEQADVYLQGLTWSELMELLAKTESGLCNEEHLV